MKTEVVSCQLSVDSGGRDSRFARASTVHCPPSTVRRQRAGVTILEVLFSILVTSVGLLGAIALFPVASAQARRARLNDAMAAAGRSAVHTFDTVGMRRPDRWLGGNIPWLATANPQFVSVSAFANSFPRGTSFCIDPRFAAVNGVNPYMVNGTIVAYPTCFPYVATWNYNTPLATRDPRMYRITLNPAPGLVAAMLPLMANKTFLLEDDLAFFRPGNDDVSNVAANPSLPQGSKLKNDRSLPAFQQFTILPSTIGSSPQSLGTRQTQGRMSWMATLVPKADIYTLNSAAPSDEYLLSIIVFADRPADMAVGDVLHERVVDVQFQSDGSTGGEVLLHWTPPSGATDKDAANYMKLRPNDWILLAANQYVIDPTTNNINPNFQPVPRFQWYRITHCDHEPTFTSAPAGSWQAGYEVYATLMGPDWPALATTHRNPHMTGFPLQGAEATLIEGVAAVYEKTIRLDYGSSF